MMCLFNSQFSSLALPTSHYCSVHSLLCPSNCLFTEDPSLSELELQMRGIATAAFRNALNGVEWIDRLSRDPQIGFPIRVISQTVPLTLLFNRCSLLTFCQEEGKLGFMTALTIAQHSHRKNPEKLIAWDSGGASFQITSLISG